MAAKIWEDFKNIFGLSDQNEFIASTEIALNERIASPFYGYFVIAWLVINWHFVYIAFFIDQQILVNKTGLMRSEYLFREISNYSTELFYVKILILPLILTIAAFWVFPYGTRIFYRKHLRNKVALEIIKFKELRKATDEQTKLLKSEVQLAKAEREAEEETPEVVWEPEFQRLRKNQAEYWRLSRLREKAYSNNGMIYNADRKEFAYYETIGLITYPDSNHILLSDKGNYFIRRFIETSGESK